MNPSIEKMVDAAIKTLVAIKEFEVGADMPALNKSIKMRHFNMIAEAFKAQDDIAYIGESIDKLYQYLDKPYVLEVQIGCVITSLLAIKRKDNILIKFSNN